jgi:hypothetical protein
MSTTASENSRVEIEAIECQQIVSPLYLAPALW